MSYVELGLIDLGETITTFDFSQTGAYYATGLLNENVIVWQNNLGKSTWEEILNQGEQYRWDGHQMGVIDLKINKNENKLVVSSLDSCIRVWNIEDGSRICEIQCQPMENWKVLFLGDNSTVVTTGELGKVHCYNINTLEQVHQFDTSNIFSTALAQSKDQALIATGNTAGQVFIFDVKNDWKQSKQEPHQKMVRSLCFTQDCHKLVTASDDKQTKVIDLVKLEPIMTFTGHKGNINCVDCSPVDNKIVMTCSYDKSIKLWDLNSKSCIQTINYHLDNVWVCKFSHNGKVITSGCENGLLAFHHIK